MIRNLALEAEAYLKARDFVSVPPLASDIWRMQMMSPERQRVNPFFTGGETISVSYPTNTMTEELVATPQPDGATYAPKIDKAEAWLDWTQPNRVLARRVRAFDPFPGASTSLQGTPIKVWRAVAVSARNAAAPGTVTDAGAEGVTIACGDGALRVTELQRPGGKRMGAREFLAGFPLRAGEHCQSPPAA